MEHVLFFCPHSPLPASSGAAHRYLQMLAALKRLGLSTTVLSSTLLLDAGWTKASITALKAEWAEDVRLYQTGPADYLAMARTQSRMADAGQKHSRDERTENAPWSLDALVPNSMRTWFSMQWRSVRPDLFWTNHAQWGGLDGRGEHAAKLRLIDSHDLVTLNLSMRRALIPFLANPPDPTTVRDEAVREDFFLHRGVKAHSDEYRLYDRYDCTIAISREEAAEIASRTSRTRVVKVPMTYAPQYVGNRYTGPALFTAGPHPFNLQGYLYFVKRVLPLIREGTPDFALGVTGTWYRGMRPVPEPGVTLCGQVADLQPLYAEARFAVSPVLGGTGESVKIVEAMAHGLPVIALSASAKSSPIHHGRNGFVATTAHEFAEYAVRLWRDPGLCCRMGQAAQETVAEERSEARLDAWLAGILAPVA